MIRWNKKKILFYRFFYTLKLQHPKLFYFFLSCCALQLLFTAIKLEATPFLLYGMFSEKLEVPDTVKFRTVYLNAVSLEVLPLSYREKEVLLSGIANYIAQKNNGGIDVVQTRVEQRYLFLTRQPVYPFLSRRIYNIPSDLSEFEIWFKQKCSGLMQQTVNKVTAFENRYTVDPFTLSVKLVARERIAFF